jgi:hypothetical protein
MVRPREGLEELLRGGGRRGSRLHAALQSSNGRA